MENGDEKRSRSLQIPGVETDFFDAYSSTPPIERSASAGTDEIHQKRQKPRTNPLSPRVSERRKSFGEYADVPDEAPPLEQKKPSSVTLSDIDNKTRFALAGMMKTHFLFGAIQESEYENLFPALKPQHMTQSEAVFKQGDSGDCCYFIVSGQFQVSIDGANLKTLESGDTFGELALLYAMKRTATVTCVSKQAKMYKMDTQRFRGCMEKLHSKKVEKAMAFFRSDLNFKSLKLDDQQCLARACSVQEFNGGDLVVREGDVGDWMLIIIAGKVDLKPHQQFVSTRRATSGEILGCVGLLYGKRHVTDAIANGRVTCLALAKTALARLPTPVEDVLRRAALRSLLQNMPRKVDEHAIIDLMIGDEQNRFMSVAEDGEFGADEIIVAPGDPAQLLVVVAGEVAVLHSVPHFEQINDCVFCKGMDVRAKARRILTLGMGYGEHPEFAQGAEMSGYVVAVGKVRIHRLTHDAVSDVLGESLSELVRRNEIKVVLSNIFLFKNLRESQIDRTVRNLERRSYAAGEVIVEQDDLAQHFYLIQSGTVCVKKGDNVLRTLGRWDYFGERGLLLHEKRSATCQAMEECHCLVLDATVFFDIVGMFKKELERRMHLQDLNITMSDLASVAVVGRGAFGVVRLVSAKKDRQKQYALKAVQKAHVVKSNQERSLVMEREVNAQCFHPCIVQFIKTFQDQHNVYFLTEFLGGGDLFVTIRQIEHLTKLQTQFFSGSICLALEYLHARTIMYRDLKPENVLLDFEGNTKLVDFGCCRQTLSASTLIGTPEYMAPEVILGKGYTCSIDWWSLGVLMYECIVGPLPFGCDAADQMALFRDILKGPLVIPGPYKNTSTSSVLRSLLTRNPDKRLGGVGNGAKSIKAHLYWEHFDWDALAGGFLEPPWKPDQEQLKKNWEHKDGDLSRYVTKGAIKDQQGMEWARGF